MSHSLFGFKNFQGIIIFFRSNIIDREKGVYVYPITNKEIELGVAIQRGLLKARLADPEEDAEHPNLLIARVWRGELFV